jgi:ABC-2 type transport system permease protein
MGPRSTKCLPITRVLNLKLEEAIVKLSEQGVLHAGLARPALRRPTAPHSAVLSYIDKTLIIAELEVRKLRHDATELITRAIQPALWLLVFGEVFTQVRAIPTGNLRYLDFMAPGILAQSVLFIAIFYGIAIIWERDLGIVHKFLASPTPRSALVLGKALSAGVRALSQAVIIYALSLLLGVNINWNPFALLGVLLVVILSAGLFSTFSLAIACLVKTRERFMGIGQVLTMPLFFASNAIYPISIMPSWLQVVANLNPLSYMVDGLRALMLSGGTAGVGFNIGVLAAVALLISMLSAWFYPKVVL